MSKELWFFFFLMNKRTMVLFQIRHIKKSQQTNDINASILEDDGEI